MKIRTVKKGRVTIYELWSDNRIKQTAASIRFIDYINSKGPNAVKVAEPKLRRLCRYREKKLTEEREQHVI